LPLGKLAKPGKVREIEIGESRKVRKKLNNK